MLGKRHTVQRKKKSKAIIQRFRGMKGRLRKQEREHEVATRKLAARASRIIKNFWMKIDRIVAYKRRLEWQKSQRKVMDRHLVHLVRQTERYTEDIAERLNMGLIRQKKGEDRVAPPKLPAERCLTERLEAADRRARETRTPRPFILDSAARLRPYQQDGLNWLVSMHERRLNGILADEMGLGKTLQTIALLAHLASQKGLWGPHLIVVPTSCLVNWESELKKFCPSLKVVTYFGAAKARKHLRAGWSRASTVHVIITSYQLAVQDASIFRRKKFYYLILDEAHNIKNFDSRRWRTLLAFQAQRRLLLTGTPLQNTLMELWSLMHFLMPQLFRSQHEFSYWFANPLQCAVEGKSKMSDDLIKRLHAIMRPFVLRRLKRDVAKQLPGKYEHVMLCRLSRRQQLLYEEFITRSSTRDALDSSKSGGDNFISMMNIVMQLRKVCNHPDLFEPRSVVAPLVLPRLVIVIPVILTKYVSPAFHAHLDAGSGASRLFSVSPVTLALRNVATVLEDNSLGAAVEKTVHTSLVPSRRSVRSIVESISHRALLYHALKSKSLPKGAAQTSLTDTRDFVLGAFRSSRPLATAWRAIVKTGTPSAGGTLVHNTRRIEANRQRLVASDTLRTQLERSATLLARYRTLFETVKRISFVVPAALSKCPALVRSSWGHHGAGYKRPSADSMTGLLSYVNANFAPMRYARLALRLSFPDRSLVQWDSGKFHELAPLLRRLKRDAHRCLVFTQMSKMLDVLELFLCWHGHSYLRLDGGTPPSDRQRLMDRFNSDTSLFCFVLSTRSGGLGVNLIGADTVIFYDSDWNPAMDAQAMDRAHRIGQTREVHIYRLICIATIEENILLKARQKQKLELVTITEGNFDSEKLLRDAPAGASRLRDFLVEQEKHGHNESDIAAAMVQLEDSEDVQNARAAAAEAATDAQEFDDTNWTTLEPGVDVSVSHDTPSNKGTASLAIENDVEALEAEFAAWQQQIGPDPDALTQSLNAVELHALKQREKQISVVSPGDGPEGTEFLTLAERRLIELIKKDDSVDSTVIDIDEIESLKQTEECRSCLDGDLLATDLYFATGMVNASEGESEFLKRRRIAKSAKRERECTGSAWELRVDAATSNPFWYNIDTAEATWLKPLVIRHRDAYLKARRGGFANWPKEISLRIISMCEPTPTRLACALVCRSWARVCGEDHLLIKVLPTERRWNKCKKEMGHLETEHLTTSPQKSSKALLKGLSTPLASISCAIDGAQPGQTLVLGPGHYWEDIPDMRVDAEIRIVGDTAMPERVIIELSSALCWHANSGSLVGMTLRRTPACSRVFSALVVQVGHLTCHRVIVDNAQGGGAAIAIQDGAYVHFDRTTVMNSGASGILLHPGAKATLAQCSINSNSHSGLTIAPGAVCFLQECVLKCNGWTHISALAGSTVALRCNLFCMQVNDATERALVQHHGALVNSRRNIGIHDYHN